MKPKKMPFKEFKSIYSRVPRLCVDLIVLTDTGIVLTKRDAPPCVGQWHLPGGTVLKGETSKEAVRRVAREELHIRVAIKKMLGIVEYTFKNYFNQSIGLVYLVTARIKTMDSGTVEHKFFSKVPSNMIRQQKKMLKLVLDGKY